jgi:CheY-like chemotaxis protein
MKEDNTILVIEDDEASAYYLEEILSEFDIRVITATTASEAIELMRKNKICLIFMDIRLPDIDGYELTTIFRNKGVKIPIIAQTAFVLPDDRAKALSSGCDDYLPKPLRKEILWETLYKYLNIPIPS